MYNGEEFKKASLEEKKQQYGTLFYDYVLHVFGDEKAPKIVGMLIDLDGPALMEIASSYNSLMTKSQEALRLMMETESAPQ